MRPWRWRGGGWRRCRRTDVIFYGTDLVDYLYQEFGIGPGIARTDPRWQPHATVEFWRDLVDWPGGGDDVVISMRAVVEAPALDTAAARLPWAVATMPPFSWLVLHAGCGDEQAGLFVAALADRVDVPPPAGRDEVVEALLAEEVLIVPGGLRVADSATGTAVAPGWRTGGSGPR